MLDVESRIWYSNRTMQVIAKYIPKKKSIQIKGFKEGYGRDDKRRLKKSHAFHMTFSRLEKGGWLKGEVDLSDIKSLEEKKTPRPKWKQQVTITRKGVYDIVITDVKTGKEVNKTHGLKLFLEGNKIFVL